MSPGRSALSRHPCPVFLGAALAALLMTHGPLACGSTIDAPSAPSLPSDLSTAPTEPSDASSDRSPSDHPTHALEREVAGFETRLMQQVWHDSFLGGQFAREFYRGPDQAMSVKYAVAGKQEWASAFVVEGHDVVALDQAYPGGLKVTRWPDAFGPSAQGHSVALGSCPTCDLTLKAPRIIFEVPIAAPDGPWWRLDVASTTADALPLE